MATIASLDVRIGAQTGELAAGMKRAEGIVAASVSRLSALGAAAGRAVAFMGVGGAAGLAGGAALVGRSAITLAADLEQAEIAFATMLGSAEKADAFLREMAAFAARTPFAFADLQDGARRMLAYGFEASKVLPIMTSLGNAVAALGGGSEMINRVILALGQMRAKGRVSGEEMRQLAEAGIPVWEMLAMKIGVSIPEAMKLSERGAIDAATGIAAVLEGMDARFTGAMERQAGSIRGLWSTAKDNISLTLTAIGREIIKTFDIGQRMRGVVAALEKLRSAFETGGIRGGIRALIGDELAQLVDTITTRLIPAVLRVPRAFMSWKEQMPGVSAAVSALPLIFDVMADAAARAVTRVAAGFAALPHAVNWALASAIAKVGEFQLALVGVASALKNLPVVGGLFGFLERMDLTKIIEGVAHWRSEADRAATEMERAYAEMMKVKEIAPQAAETATTAAKESIIRITGALGEEIKGTLSGGFGKGGAEGAAAVKQHISSLQEYAAAHPVVIRVRYVAENPLPGVSVTVPAG